MNNSLKIALLGYGKMGKIIEQIAIDRGHTIVLKITSKNADFTVAQLTEKQVDVAIEFSRPEYAAINISKCIAAEIPVAIGTTGWYDQFELIEKEVQTKNGCILPATNFSIGVNLFFEINKKLAQLMNPQKQYTAAITEIHHLEKLDAPSGTAITTAEGILSATEGIDNWALNQTDSKTDLVIKAERKANVPGTHEVTYESDIDTISLSHVAKNRKGFGLGAVMAAEFLIGKKGIYTMKDVLDI